MDGRVARMGGAVSGLVALVLAASCQAAGPDRLDESFAADDALRRPYVSGVVASSASGPGSAAGLGGGPVGGDGACGVAVPQPAGDLRLELDARLPRDDGSWATTANAWRDVRLGDRLSVYAGGGLGMGAAAAASPGDAAGTALAWQAGAGATYALTPRVTFDVGYRFHGLEGRSSGAPGPGEVVMAVRVFEPLRGWLR